MRPSLLLAQRGGSQIEWVTTMQSKPIFGFMTLLGLAASAQAQDRPAAQADVGLEQCRAIGNDSDRLECYDTALDRIYGVDEELQAKRQEHRRDRFGLPTDSSGFQLTELEATVVEVKEDMSTRTVFIALDNGQVWQLLSTGGLRASFKSGMAVVISESGTGGYRIRIHDKPGFKGVKRVS